MWSITFWTPSQSLCYILDPQDLTQFMKLAKVKVMSGIIPIFVPPCSDKEPLWEIRRTENIAFTTGVKPPHLVKDVRESKYGL